MNKSSNREKIKALRRQIRKLECELDALESIEYAEEDSPKGETVPGVRYKY